MICLTLHLLSWLLAVIDHGIASVEMMMEEALQDVPSLVKDIQERLRCMEHSYLHMYQYIVSFLHHIIKETKANTCSSRMHVVLQMVHDHCNSSLVLYQLSY